MKSTILVLFSTLISSGITVAETNTSDIYKIEQSLSTFYKYRDTRQRCYNYSNRYDYEAKKQCFRSLQDMSYDYKKARDILKEYHLL